MPILGTCLVHNGEVEIKDWYVKPFMGHYVLVVGGVEVCHTDTYREAIEEYNEYYLVNYA